MDPFLTFQNRLIMSKSIDVRPSLSGRLVDVVLNSRTTSWKDVVESSISPESRVRIFTDPMRRAGQIKKFYYSFRGLYPDLSPESVDYAMEMYLLGWIDCYQVVRVARQYDASMQEVVLPF